MTCASKCKELSAKRLSLLVGMCLLHACTPEPRSTNREGASLATRAQPGCCAWFEQELDARLPPNVSLVTLEAKIEWLAHHRPAEARVLGELALEQIRRRRPDSTQHAVYDLIIIGGGLSSALIGCNTPLASAEESSCIPRRKLVISQDLGGPFAAYGRAFYLNTPDPESNPQASMNLLAGCPIQLHPFVAADANHSPYASRNSFVGDVDGQRLIYSEADVLGTVILLNLMLSGADFAVGDLVPEGGIRRAHDASGTFEVQSSTGVFTGKRVVIASGHGEPSVPEGLRELTERERGANEPKVEVLDEFFARIQKQPGSDTTRLSHYGGLRVGIVGGNDGASSLADFFLGVAPPLAYGAPPPDERPLAPNGMQLIQFGQKSRTGSEFRAALAPYKAFRYDAVAKALDEGRIKPVAEQVFGVREAPSGTLEVLYGTASAPGVQEVDRLFIAVGYDASRAYRLLSSEGCDAPREYKAVDVPLPTGPNGSAQLTHIAEVPTCRGHAVAGLYVFVPPGLSENPTMRSIRHLAPRAKALGDVLLQTSP